MKKVFKGVTNDILGRPREVVTDKKKKENSKSKNEYYKNLRGKGRSRRPSQAGLDFQRDGVLVERDESPNRPGRKHSPSKTGRNDSRGDAYRSDGRTSFQQGRQDAHFDDHQRPGDGFPATGPGPMGHVPHRQNTWDPTVNDASQSKYYKPPQGAGRAPRAPTEQEKVEAWKAVRPLDKALPDNPPYSPEDVGTTSSGAIVSGTTRSPNIRYSMANPLGRPLGVPLNVSSSSAVVSSQNGLLSDVSTPPERRSSRPGTDNTINSHRGPDEDRSDGGRDDAASQDDDEEVDFGGRAGWTSALPSRPVPPFSPPTTDRGQEPQNLSSYQTNGLYPNSHERSDPTDKAKAVLGISSQRNVAPQISEVQFGPSELDTSLGPKQSGTEGVGGRGHDREGENPTSYESKDSRMRGDTRLYEVRKILQTADNDQDLARLENAHFAAYRVVELYKHYKSERDDLFANNQAMGEQIASFRKNKRAHAAAEAKVKELDSKLTAKTREHEQLQQHLDTKNDLNALSKDKIHQLTEEVRGLIELKNKAVEDHKTADASYAETLVKVNDLEEAIATARKANKSLQDQLNASRASEKGNLAKITDLERQRDRMGNEHKQKLSDGIERERVRVEKQWRETYDQWRKETTQHWEQQVKNTLVETEHRGNLEIARWKQDYERANQDLLNAEAEIDQKDGRHQAALDEKDRLHGEEIAAHQQSFQRQTEQMQTNLAAWKPYHDGEMLRVATEHAGTIEDLKTSHRGRMKDLKKGYDDQFAGFRGEILGLQQDIESLKAEHATSLFNLEQSLRAEHATEIYNLNSQHEQDRKADQDEIQRLNNAMESFRAETEKYFEDQFKGKLQQAKQETLQEKERTENMRRVIVKRDRFQGLSDSQIKQKFQQLAMAVEQSARRWGNMDWDASKKASWPVKEMEIKAHKNARELKQFIHQHTIWSILYNGIFSTPFKTFGDEGLRKYDIWCEKQTLGLDLTSEITPHWPIPSKEAEERRYTDAEECLNAVVKPDGDPTLKAAYLRGMSNAGNEISRALSRVQNVSDREKNMIKELVKQAARLWLDLAIQRCRIVVEVPLIEGDPGVTSEEIQRGSKFTLEPGLHRIGASDGTKLDTVKDKLLPMQTEPYQAR